ncbi:hypothetical protein DPMN_079554 [Dreissena polymorpha]|uniref:Uncharacterized protein n=1 Tax=Dreissena polymorpha TaxID=45954 RepID=A0A9D3YSE4_DREPO|nr:hypothetical protein DPMN_079554 [Dreissena polymorpha]
MEIEKTQIQSALREFMARRGIGDNPDVNNARPKERLITRGQSLAGALEISEMLQVFPTYLEMYWYETQVINAYIGAIHGARKKNQGIYSQRAKPKYPIGNKRLHSRGYFTTWRFLLFPLAVGLAIGLGCNTIRRRCSGESGYDMVQAPMLKMMRPTKLKTIMRSLVRSYPGRCKSRKIVWSH